MNKVEKPASGFVLLESKLTISQARPLFFDWKNLSQSSIFFSVWEDSYTEANEAKKQELGTLKVNKMAADQIVKTC